MNVGGWLRAFRRRGALGAASHLRWPPAICLAAMALSMGVGITAASDDGEGREGRGACAGTTLEATAGRLQAEFGDRIGRFILTVRSSEAEATFAIDRRTDQLAADLRQAGALMAQPIVGQPLLVVEVRGSQLRELAGDPRIVCIERDTPEPPTW